MTGLCFLAGVVFVPPLLAKPLDHLGLLPQKEQLTELYFADYRKLPPTLQSGQPMKVAFVVRNLENRAMTYRYVILAASDTDTQKLAEGTLSLAPDQQQTTEKQLVFPATAGSTRVSVVLTYGSPSRMQAIHYWVTAVGGEKGAS